MYFQYVLVTNRNSIYVGTLSNLGARIYVASLVSFKNTIYMQDDSQKDKKPRHFPRMRSWILSTTLCASSGKLKYEQGFNYAYSTVK